MADEESPSSPPECFICTDTAPPPRRSACKCTDRHVHDACLVRMLETSTHTGCPVCAAPYANVSCTSRVVGVRAYSEGIAALALLLLAPTLLWCAWMTWRLHCCGPHRLSPREEQFVLFAAIIMAIAGAMGIAYLGNLCVVFGPTVLARSTLVRKRTARVLEVLPPRIAVEEFEIAERHTR